MTATVEQLLASDWRRWRQLRLRALRSAPAAFAPSAHAWVAAGDTPERWQSLTSSYSAMFVASQHGQDVGMAAALPRAGGATELAAMWVQASARRQGVGHALVFAVLDEAAGRPVLLRVMADNDRAIGFYTGLGFVRHSQADAEGKLTMWRAGAQARS